VREMSAFLCGCVLVLAGVIGCGSKVEESKAPVLLTRDDYTAWRRVSEALVARTKSGEVIHTTSFVGLAEELKESEWQITADCVANKIIVRRFLAVCRAIGIAYSVINAEEIDQESARMAADMVGHSCDDVHDSVLEEPPDIALMPRQPPPPIIGEHTDETLARNVEFLRPFAPEVEQLSAELFGKPADETNGTN